MLNISSVIIDTATSTPELVQSNRFDKLFRSRVKIENKTIQKTLNGARRYNANLKKDTGNICLPTTARITIKSKSNTPKTSIFIAVCCRKSYLNVCSSSHILFVKLLNSSSVKNITEKRTIPVIPLRTCS